MQFLDFMILHFTIDIKPTECYLVIGMKHGKKPPESKMAGLAALLLYQPPAVKSTAAAPLLWHIPGFSLEPLRNLPKINKKDCES